MVTPAINPDVLISVSTAMIDAYTKHGPLTTDPVRACAILGREWGEAMDEALLATRTYDHKSTLDSAVSAETWAAHDNELREQAVGRLYDELAQVAATAITIMERIQEARIGEE